MHEIKTEINLDENKQPCAVDRKYNMLDRVDV